MITNENGEVAVRYLKLASKIVRVGGHSYAFAVRANICMSWVKHEHVGRILQMTTECCGGQRKRSFQLANESAARRWTVGGGR